MPSVLVATGSQLADEIDRIASSTSFNGIQLLNTSATFKINVGSDQTIDVEGMKLSSSTLGVKSGDGLKETYDNNQSPFYWLLRDDPSAVADRINGLSPENFQRHSQLRHPAHQLSHLLFH